ncbi:MAG: PD40 domain-containing protein [Chloroflexi bacterium]|nr:PD40 domain-containing protein [Chloroflexota bacterium]
MKVKAISLLLAVMLAACSIQISDVTPGPTAPVQVAATPASALPPATSAGPAWAGLNLSGQLLFTQGVSGVERVNLATGARVTLFKPPENAWLTAAAVSPDASQIVLAYAPPPPEGQIQFGYTSLYLMPADASATPAPMLERTDPQESYFTPSWSPDGKYIYYAHFIPLKGESGNTFRYTVERLALGGSPEVLVDNAIWPRLSPDGSKLAYLSFDLQTFNNDLYVAEADGQNARPVIPPGTFQAVDAHLWMPDGEAILFSAVGEGPAYQSTPAPALSWLDRLLGVEAASAHNVPSDWWRVSLDATALTRLTKIYDTGMYGSFAPDGSRLAFIAASGVYVMNPDGSGLTPMIPVETLGTLEWIR